MDDEGRQIVHPAEVGRLFEGCQQLTYMETIDPIGPISVRAPSCRGGGEQFLTMQSVATLAEGEAVLEDEILPFFQQAGALYQ